MYWDDIFGVNKKNRVIFLSFHDLLLKALTLLSLEECWVSHGFFFHFLLFRKSHSYTCHMLPCLFMVFLMFWVAELCLLVCWPFTPAYIAGFYWLNWKLQFSQAFHHLVIIMSSMAPKILPNYFFSREPALSANFVSKEPDSKFFN